MQIFAFLCKASYFFHLLDSNKLHTFSYSKLPKEPGILPG